MPNVLPTKQIEQIEWFQNRIQKWTLNQASIGLSLAQVQAQGDIGNRALDTIFEPGEGKRNAVVRVPTNPCLDPL